MEPLRNCPNCGGYLNDSGRCEFCGSKIYDFVGLDFDRPTKTYLRMKYQGQIITLPVHINDFALDLSTECTQTGTLHFEVVGNSIVESVSEGSHGV